MTAMGRPVAQRPSDPLADLRARLALIGQVRRTADDVIDEALRAGITPLEVSRLTGWDRSGLHRRRTRLQKEPAASRE